MPTPPTPAVPGSPDAAEPLASAAPVERPSIKLIVWDLDETFWRGTITEGPVETPPRRVDQWRRLVDRGVMVSISSRNDLDLARSELERLGVWDLAIFPRINWSAKGPQVRDLVEAAQLRTTNVLFVDDNHLNRAEVAAAAPGIHIADPADPGFDPWVEAIIESGKPDPDHGRLAQYKLLEARATVADTFEDNEAFLRASAIEVTFVRPIKADADRIHDLVVRTNQLNYRKVRTDLEGVQALLADPRTEAWMVRVADRFGDYGIVGFVAVRDGVAEQLAFSCRILGMGVERAVYERLGRPSIEVAEPVSAPLDGAWPDWLTVSGGPGADDSAAAEAGRGAGTMAGPSATHEGAILFVGGCDLQSTVAFLGGDAVRTYFNHSPADRPRLVIHRDSIDFLLADDLDAAARQRVVADAPFLDESVFDVPDWSEADHIVYSPLIDYIQAKYVHPAVPGFYLSYGDVEEPWIDEARVATMATRGVDPDAMRRFAREWRAVTKPDEVWEAQLRRLFERMRGARSVTVLLGATHTFDGLDAERIPTHRHHNALIGGVVAEFPNATTIEVDPLLRDRSDFSDAIRHYGRRVYYELATEIRTRVDGLELAEPARRPSRSASTGPAASVRRMVGRSLRRVGLRD